MQMCKEIGLFGVPFDPTVSSESLLIKLAYIRAKMYGKIIYPDYLDPYDYLSNNLPPAFSKKTFLLGKIQMPTWLRPKPTPADLSKLNLDSFASFMEKGGCLRVAAKVHNFITNKVLPRIPGMIGVDHSSTYGAILSLKKYQREELALIVLDSHFDAVPAKLRQELFEYAKRANVPFIAQDLYFQSNLASPTSSSGLKSEQLDAENFLLYVINHKMVDAKNLVVIGISDYPSKLLEKVNDRAVRKYVNFFKSLEKLGVHFVPKLSLCKCKNVKSLIEEALEGLTAERIYVSMDIDVGSLSSVYAARYLNTIGLSLEQIRNIFKSLLSFFSGRLTLCGFDLMEIDIHKLGARINGSHKDETGEISKMFLEFIGKVSS